MTLLTRFFYQSTLFLEAMRRKSTQSAAPIAEAPRTIPIDTEVLNRIQEFAIYFNIPVEEAIHKAVKEWMDATGDVMMAFTENERRKAASRPRLILVKRPMTGFEEKRHTAVDQTHVI